MKNIQSIDDYINQFSPSIKEKLNSIRSTIKIIAPQAEEAIKYGIPTFIFQENLVHFAAFKNHIGFYPTSSGVRTFKDELAQYKTSKGAIQFPINKPVPLLLIKKIVKFRILEIKNKIKRWVVICQPKVLLEKFFNIIHRHLIYDKLRKEVGPLRILNP